jgi:nitrogen regulatory protein PII 2
MKEIIAIIRPERAESTKNGLDAIGVKGITFMSVIGRGRQKGTIRSLDPEGSLRRQIGVQIMHHRGLIDNPDDPKYHVPVVREIELGFLLKKMLLIVADDTEVLTIVNTIIQLNKSEHWGDGRIFVCPIKDAIRIRTGERGNKALL